MKDVIQKTLTARTSYFGGSSANMYIIASDMLKDGAVMCNYLSEKPYVWNIESAVGCTANIQQMIVENDAECYMECTYKASGNE